MKSKKKFEQRYWLFSWSTFYPSGGLEDIVFTSDDLEKCYAFELLNNNGYLFDSVEKVKIKIKK